MSALPVTQVRLRAYPTGPVGPETWQITHDAPTAPGPNQVLFVGSVGKVYKMDLTGKVLGAFGRLGKIPGTIDSIHQLACPDEKTVYLANLYAGRLDKWVAE